MSIINVLLFFAPYKLVKSELLFQIFYILAIIAISILAI